LGGVAMETVESALDNKEAAASDRTGWWVKY